MPGPDTADWEGRGSGAVGSRPKRSCSTLSHQFVHSSSVHSADWAGATVTSVFSAGGWPASAMGSCSCYGSVPSATRGQQLGWLPYKGGLVVEQHGKGAAQRSHHLLAEDDPRQRPSPPEWSSGSPPGRQVGGPYCWAAPKGRGGKRHLARMDLARIQGAPLQDEWIGGNKR